MATFDAQLKESLPHLWRYGFSLTRAHHQTDDLVQDTVERGILKRSLWDALHPLRPWLMKIELNIFRDKYRANARAQEVAMEDDFDIGAVDRTIEARSELRAVMKRMNDLPDEQRQPLLLVSIGGLSYAQAAEVLDVPIGTIMSRISRARAFLNKEAAPQVPGIRSAT
ncbi:MAG: RNA polymerase sigma factor [Cognatishimia activa]